MENKTARFTKVQETERRHEPQTFTELLMREIYKTVMAELDADDQRELDVYEYDFDYGDPSHAETAEQYDECVAKIMASAAEHVLERYVIHTEDELADKAEKQRSKKN